MSEQRVVQHRIADPPTAAPVPPILPLVDGFPLLHRE